MKKRDFISIIYRSVLEVLYPVEDKCIICSNENVQGICAKCMKSITFSIDDESCVGYYKGVLKQLILNFKYNQDFVAGQILVDLLEEKIASNYEGYCLTFIPITKKRLKERGFNQCKYLAEELAFRKGIEVIDCLEKVKETKSQKTLDRDERRMNLINSFKIKNQEMVKGKKIILIDDVITTGATIDEGIKTLKKNGVLEIKILTLAKTHI